MAEARPFVGLLYDVAIAGSIETLTSPPYDVISPQEQERLHRAGPYNMVRLVLGRDHPAGLGRGDKYTKAASLLRSWRDDGVLKATPVPSVFPYEFDFRLGGIRRRVRGIILEVDLEPWGGSIVPHERTMPGPMHDRLALLRAVRANLSAVYMVMAGQPASDPVTAFLDGATSSPPLFELTDESGTRHRLWAVPGPLDQISQALREHPLLIADGHHRYSVALAYRDEMRARFGPGPWDAIMALVVDAGAEDPPVLPIHRLLVGDDRPKPTGDRVMDLAEILATVDDDALTYGVVTSEDGEIVHRVAALAGQPPTVCALHDQILDRLTAPGLRFVADAATVEADIRAGGGSAAFILPATRVDRVWSVVREGRRLPQKSTYFWPKPRTGLVMRSLQPTDIRVGGGYAVRGYSLAGSSSFFTSVATTSVTDRPPPPSRKNLRTRWPRTRTASPFARPAQAFRATLSQTETGRGRTRFPVSGTWRRNRATWSPDGIGLSSGTSLNRPARTTTLTVTMAPLLSPQP
jgi:uncharacterized protein (DUF1015 family)